MSVVPIVRGSGEALAVGLPTRQIHNQGEVNCCFSCAIASAIEAGDVNMPALAPLFHFHEADGELLIDEGLGLAEAKRALLTAGICMETLHPFPITRANVSVQPSEAARLDGLAHRPLDRVAGGLRWKTLPIFLPERSWKRCLSAGFPIVIGFQLIAGYRALNAAEPVLQANSGSGPLHAAAVIGYRDADSAFIVQDSRGPTFGAGGQWFLPYDLCAPPFVAIAFALAPDDFH